MTDKEIRDIKRAVLTGILMKNGSDRDTRACFQPITPNTFVRDVHEPMLREHLIEDRGLWKVT